MPEVDWTELRTLHSSLYDFAERLERLFSSRKFALDGKLLGSIGVVIAAYMFGLDYS